MRKVSRFGLCPLVVLAALVIAPFAPTVCVAEDGVRLRAIDLKPFYKPGDRIEIELRCLGAVTEDPVVLYNGSLEKIDSGSFVPDLPKCPSSRFPIEIPLDFIGKNRVTARVQHGERRYEDVFEFEVRSDARPSDLRLTTESLTDDSQDEGCHLPIFRKGRAPSEIHLFSVMGDGIQFDLCKGVQFTVATEPAGSGVLAMKDGRCILTPKKPGAFKLIASHRGLRKEWSCAEDAPESKPPPPRPTALPAKKISVDEFQADPTRLDRHPVEIGRCRTVEHWDTGYCYVFSEGRKVSQPIDDRCDNLAGLRDRMLKAIRQGFCDSRAADPELENPATPHIPTPNPLTRTPSSSLPAPGSAGSPLRISIPAFRYDPSRLDRHPMDVGKCRLIEHDTTGDCYIYSFPDSQQVSETPDVRCTDLKALRRSMRIAIDEGHCGIPAGERAGQEQLKETMSEMRRLATNLEAYAVDYNSYPVATDVSALAKLIEPKYIGKTPLRDGWGTPFAYVCDGKQYRIVSAGADRSFEPDSTKLDKTPDGETSSLARDVIYSNGRFAQWPRAESR